MMELIAGIVLFCTFCLVTLLVNLLGNMFAKHKVFVPRQKNNFGIQGYSTIQLLVVIAVCMTLLFTLVYNISKEKQSKEPRKLKPSAVGITNEPVVKIMLDNRLTVYQIKFNGKNLIIIASDSGGVTSTWAE